MKKEEKKEEKKLNDEKLVNVTGGRSSYGFLGDEKGKPNTVTKKK